MDKKTISSVMSEMGKRRAAKMTTAERSAGGKARAAKLTKKRRKEIATIASKAAAAKRLTKTPPAD